MNAFNKLANRQNLRDSSKLMDAFLKNKDDKDLFGKPAKFKKVPKRI